MIKIQPVRQTTIKLQTQVFSRPQKGDRIDYREDQDLPTYRPFLVEIVEWNGNLLKFHAISPETGADASKDYVVDLSRPADVLRLRPSTLEGYDPAAKKTCALLFLTDEYTDDHYDESGQVIEPVKQDLVDAQPVILDGCPKTPCRGGSLVQMVEDLTQLRRDNVELRSDNSALRIDNADFRVKYATIAALHAELKHQLREVLGMLSAEQQAKINMKLLA